MKLKLLLLTRILAGLIIFVMVFSGFGLAAFSSDETDSGTSSRNFPLYDRDVFVDTITINDYFIVPGIFAQKHYPGQQVNLTTQVWNLGTKSIPSSFEVLMVILDDINTSSFIPANL